MKKTLIALAAVAATGVAFAQSTVTLYGVADLSIAKNGTTVPTATAPAVRNSAQMSGNGLMNNGSSRLGVRGVEDLGGGLKAAFNFEQGINAETGATDANTFQRAANMSLMGGFGTVKLGRTLTPSFFGVAAWELTGTANYSVVANQFAYAGSGSRNNSELSYTTPSMGGLTATVGYVFKGDNAVANTPLLGTTNRAKTDLNVIYRGGPVVASLSYNKLGGMEKNYAIGGSYDLGAFKVAASFQDPAGAAKGFTVGAGTTLGPVSLVVDVARDTNAKDTDFLVEAKYPLSKRTTVYAAYLNDGEKKIVAPRLAAAATATNAAVTAAPGATKTNFGVGIRHNF